MGARHAQPPQRSRLHLAMAALGVMLGLAGAVGVVLLALGKAGGVSASGSSGPQQAVEQLVEAANSEDLLGIVSTLAPDEIPNLDTVVETLQNEAEDAGVSGLSGGDGIDAEMTLSDVSVFAEGDNAAIVEFTLEGSLDSSELEGPLGELLPDVLEFSTDDLLGHRDDDDVESYETTQVTDAVAGFASAALVDAADEQEQNDGFGESAITEVFVVTVKLDGDWYISPMLTAGEYVVRSLNLLPGDYDLIGEEQPAAGAESGDVAVSTLLQGVADLDIDSVADVLAPGEARLALVFEDAIEDLLFEIPPDLISNLEVETSTLDDGRVRLREAAFLLSYYDEYDGYTTSVDVEVDDDCLTLYDYEYGDRERACVSRIQPYYDPSDGGLVFSTVVEDDLTKVDLIATASSIVLDVLTQVDWPDVIASTDLALYGAAETVELPAEVAMSFDGQPSRVFEFTAEPGVTYSIDADGDYGDWDIYVVDEDGAWAEEWDDIWTVATPTRARVVVTSESECNEYYCVRTGEGDIVVRIGIVERVAAEFPLAASGELGPGESVVLEFTTDREHYVALDITGPAASPTSEVSWDTTPDGESSFVDWRLVGSDGGSPSLPYLPAGDYALELTNYGDSAITYTVESTEVDPMGFGGQSSTSVDLSNGSVTISGTTAPGEWFSISASPYSDQDIVLWVFDGNGATLCSVDVNYGGDGEWCEMYADSTGRFTVEVSGYDSSDFYGTVGVEYIS